MDTKQDNISVNETPSVTYAILLAAYQMHLSLLGKSAQEIKNAVTALKSWINALLNSDLESLIEKEFSENFDSSIEKYISQEQERSIKKSTYRPRVTILGDIRNFYLKWRKIQFLPKPFNECLSHLLTTNNYSAEKFIAQHLTGELGVTTLRKWCQGVIPHPHKLPVIEKIEQVFQLLSGTLTSRLATPFTVRYERAGYTSFGDKLRMLQGKGFRVWTEALELELIDLSKFKSKVSLRGLERTDLGTWTPNEAGELPSMGKARGFLMGFLGFATCSEHHTDPMLRGLGMDVTKLSIALLSDQNVVDQYLTEFYLARAGGLFHHGFLAFISDVKSLLRPGTGYLYQKPEFALKLGLELTVEEWQEKCRSTWEHLKKIEKEILAAKKSGVGFALGRDPQEPIRGILELDCPLDVTSQMVQDMIEDIDKLGPYKFRQATLFRDALFIAMLQGNPLRVRMFSFMKFDQHLVKKSDGSWWFNFGKGDFKNRRSLIGDYKTQVNSSLWSMIDTYKDVWRPILLKGRGSQHIFVNPNQNKNPHDCKFTPGSLSRIVRDRTIQYIPECIGFGPHSFRHIVATAIIKADPSAGFFLAAKVLHDKLETVERTYAHLKTDDFLKPYNIFLSKFWKDRKMTFTSSQGVASGGENDK